MKTNKKTEMLEAIIGFCESCSGEEGQRGCGDKKCPLYSVRNGIVKGKKGIPWFKKAIRERCLECCGFESRTVLLCESYECCLWEFRLGDGEKAKKPKTLDERLFDDEPEDELSSLLFD